MTRSRFLCIFICILLSPSLVSSDEEELRREMDHWKDACSSQITALEHYIREQMVEDLVKALQAKYENQRLPAAHNEHRRTMDESIENLVQKMTNLSARIDEFSQEVNNMKIAFTPQFQNVTSDVNNVNCSLRSIGNKVDGLNGTSLNSSDRSKFVLQGLIVETKNDHELITISLPSLQQNVLHQSDLFGTRGAAFDLSARTVYWVSPFGIEKAHLDGTNAKWVVEDGLQADAFGIALDSISGNFYYGNDSGNDIRVCSREGEKCPILVTDQRFVRSIALNPSKSLMFWSSGYSTGRANMDGTNVSVIFSEEVRSISVDEDRARLFGIDSAGEHIFSSDLDGIDRKVLLNDTNAELEGIAVHGDTVYFGSGKIVKSVNKHGGNPVVIAETNGKIRSIALYGSKTHFRENPCASSPCSHLCVPKLDSFVCLCPDGKQLQRDGTTCL